MNKIIPNTLATLFLTACSVSASVTVIESTPEKLTFRWEIGKIDTASLSDSSGGVFSSISFSDGNITLGNAGESAIPGQSVFAGVPASGTLRIRFSPGATTTLSLSHPLKVRPANQLPDKFRFADQWISQPSYSRFRDLRAAQFVIRPFSSVKNSRSVRILTSAECTVEFPVPAPSISSGARTAAGDYERMLRKLLLNYDVAAAWRDQGSTARAASQRKTACEDAVFADDPGMRRLKFKIGDGHNYMNEVTTKENGVLKITGAQILRLLKPSTPVYIADIVLYASWKGELPEVPPAADSIPDGLIRIPLLCADNGTAALLDSSDYFLAFVTGLSDWGYDTAGHDFIFNIDKYDDDRTYWLAIKKGACGKSMPVFVQPSPASTTDDYFVNRALFQASNARPSSMMKPDSPGSASLSRTPRFNIRWICPVSTLQLPDQ
ncbi:MAG: hypothetical protein MUF22_06530 [Chitinispirillaceae bacterium]|nr:hypothetical protein [Chitinispirillaceae bacterium]